MDYECPPCRSIDPTVPKMISRCRSKVDLITFNYPLTKIHPYAKFAAIAAEAAKEQGKFDDFHKLLIDENDLSKNNILRLARTHSLDMVQFQTACKSTALSKVTEDIHLGDMVKISGTPTFLVCSPNGDVYRLGSLSQLPEIVK